ncbi:putative transcription factor GRAS family [Medicago truncatula]|uniref:Putative transcription factor GRAS family n=1 Tax=Medicago truncatula TaxID=3880 RepID=A0A396JBF4_MEDTR|nr:putative transcription factor GRAS family [Medicago truncatula]
MHVHMKAELKATSISFQNPTLFNTHQNTPPLPEPEELKGCLGSLDGACIEKLLLHCASALESNDITLAQQVMWVLNNVASPLGDTNQRLTSWFLRALISRASRICPTSMNFKGSNYTIQRRLMSVTELAGEDEALVINCQNWLRYLSDDRKGQNISLRDAFMNLVKGLNPQIVLLVDEDCDLSASSLTSRITASFNHLWIPFDALDTFLPKDSCQRTEFESDIGQKIENIISFEGHQRIERLESGMQMSQRMKNAGYFSVPFCEETVLEVKGLLDEHASGWGMKREESMLVLTWKGNSCVFATAWVPSEIRDHIGMDAHVS